MNKYKARDPHSVFIMFVRSRVLTDYRAKRDYTLLVQYDCAPIHHMCSLLTYYIIEIKSLIFSEPQTFFQRYDLIRSNVYNYIGACCTANCSRHIIVDDIVDVGRQVPMTAFSHETEHRQQHLRVTGSETHGQQAPNCFGQLDPGPFRPS